MCCPARSVDGWRIRGLRSWPVCQVATQLAATKPTTPFELQFLSLLTSAKARIDTHNYHTTHPPSRAFFFLPPVLPPHDARVISPLSFSISSSPTRHHQQQRIFFASPEHTTQNNTKRKKEEEEQLEVYSRSPISRPHHTTPPAQPIHTHTHTFEERVRT